MYSDVSSSVLNDAQTSVQHCFDATNTSNDDNINLYENHDNRKSNLLYELDYYLNRCQASVETNKQNAFINGSYQCIPAQKRTQTPKKILTAGNNSCSNPTLQQLIQEGNYSVYTLTKNYIALATEYYMWDRYRLHRKLTNPCVICLKNDNLVKVFFPCEHRCVCETCYHHYSKRIQQCPLCKEDIRLSVDYSKNALAKYWEWVNQIRPSLPSTFVSNFYSRSMIAIEEERNVQFDETQETKDIVKRCIIL